MPTWGYSFTEQKYDAERLSKASGRDIRIKPKHAREICAVIKGMKIDQAKTFLEKVINMEQSVPFRRHKKKVAHKHDLKQFNWYAGRYPQKAAARIVGDLEVKVTTENTNRVEFYVDDVLKETVYSPPYVWTWNEKSFGEHIIKIIAYDNNNYSGCDNNNTATCFIY